MAIYTKETKFKQAKKDVITISRRGKYKHKN